MKWIKKGLIYNVSKDTDWTYSHAHKPSILFIDEKRLRIYFGVRDRQKQTRTTFIDVDPDNPKKILYIHDRPILDLGKLGTFDDSGVNVSSVVRHNDLIYMYFFGWNPGTTVPSRNSIGVACSRDNGLTFERLFDGPVIGRTIDEPYYTGNGYVLVQNGLWKIWYTSGSRFELINGRVEVSYHIKYAESKDGIRWDLPGADCILPRHPYEVTARPSVMYEDGMYKMWYTYRSRSMEGFRESLEDGYRIGYAESDDGKKWIRMDDKAGIGLSAHGWDSQMIAYPAVYRHNGRLYILYNGNGFGASGFGYAIGEEE